LPILAIRIHTAVCPYVVHFFYYVRLLSRVEVEDSTEKVGTSRANKQKKGLGKGRKKVERMSRDHLHFAQRM